MIAEELVVKLKSSFQYLLKCDVKRSMLSKDVQKVIEFIIECKRPDENVAPMKMDMALASLPASGGQPIEFSLSPESLLNVKDVSLNLKLSLEQKLICLFPICRRAKFLSFVSVAELMQPFVVLANHSPGKLLWIVVSKR